MVLRSPGSVLLISCYELGHQPMGVALPLGFLQRAGFAPDVIDIAVEKLDLNKIERARFVGISVPMHTALRLGVRVAERIREVNPACEICFYGLYAALNSEYLLGHGANYCIGGEYEGSLTALVEAIEAGEAMNVDGVSAREHPSEPYLKRLEFAEPSRNLLPTLDNYSQLVHQGELRTAGYVEASRGCLHLCTHCPIPPVYEGRFFTLPQDVILEDIRRQVLSGAKHISFGDPDFLNGPTHSFRVVRAMHEEFPDLTFDFTAKIEHLLKRGEHLPDFARMGCLFIISAVESLSGRVLGILEKHHTRAEVQAALDICQGLGITLRPTWVAFTPWTTRDDYIEMLEFIESNDIIDHVDPVQFSIRLLIPPGSWIADHPEAKSHLGQLDEAAFSFRWEHPDPQMDKLQKDVSKLVEKDAADQVAANTTFFRIKELALGRQPSLAAAPLIFDRILAPRMTESWFC